jgi:ankyrin repeat protein
MAKRKNRLAIPLVVLGMVAAISGMVWIGITVKKSDQRIQLGERLIAAVNNGTSEDVYGALLAGADPNDASGVSPFMEAIRAGKQDMAAYLIKAGADPSRALFSAATKQEVESVVALGADIKTPMKPYAMDLLSTHVVQAHPEVVAYLLDHDIRPSDAEALVKLLDLNQFAESKDPKQGKAFTEIREMLRVRGLAH